MNARELLKQSQHIAVVGVSDDVNKYGYKIYKRLLDLNYNVVGISPKYQTLCQKTVYSSLLDVPHPIDLVVFVVRKEFVYDYLPQMQQLHIPYAWMQPNTYDEQLLNTIQSSNITPICACVLVETM